MTKWEYLPVEFRCDELKRFKDGLNELGEAGWDRAVVTDGVDGTYRNKERWFIR